ncbi:hypothetical protein B7463_g6345, partial [Scytalidium lignicola]
MRMTSSVAVQDYTPWPIRKSGSGWSIDVVVSTLLCSTLLYALLCSADNFKLLCDVQAFSFFHSSAGKPSPSPVVAGGCDSHSTSSLAGSTSTIRYMQRRTMGDQLFVSTQQPYPASRFTAQLNIADSVGLVKLNTYVSKIVNVNL